MQRVVAVLALGALLVGCPRVSIDWRSHRTLRSAGAGSQIRLGQVDPGEVYTGKIVRGLHYVRLELETVFFRDLPIGAAGGDVVFGFEVQGVLPGGRPLKSVGAVRRIGSDGFLFFDRVAHLQPFLYTGQSISVTLHFRMVPSDEASSIQSRLEGVSDIVRRLNPMVPRTLSTARDLFAAALGATTAKSRAWTYGFTFHPADTTIHDKPEMLFLAARHILLAMPPADAPEGMRRLRRESLPQDLKLVGSRLVWRRDGRPYVETPYIVLNVTRYKRYPLETELRRVKERLEAAVANENYDRADAALRELGAAIVRDRYVTTDEKNLERAWREFWALRIAAARAKASKERRVKLLLKSVEQLLRIKDHFRHILEEAEIRNLAYQTATLTKRAQDLLDELGASLPPELKAELEQDKKRDRVLALKSQEEADRARRRFGAKVGSASGLADTRVRPAPGGRVQVDARVQVPASISEAEARARAVALALRAAARWAAGAPVGDRYFGRLPRPSIQNRRLGEPLRELLADVLVTDQKVLESERVAAAQPGGYGYRVRLLVRAVRRSARADLGYRVDVMMSKRALRPGEKVEFEASATRDSHLYLFSIEESGAVTMLIPNGFMKAPFLKAGQSVRFPPLTLLLRSFRFRAGLPPGAVKTAERIKAVALRRPVQLVAKPTGRRLPTFRARDSGLATRILRALAGLDPDAWTDATLRYTISR